jgi:drug/metabolite transporter (DMT)-like permease
MISAILNELTGPLRAIGLRLAAALLNAGVAAALRLVSRDLPIGEVVFFRSFIAAFLIGAFYLFRAQLRTALYTRRPFAHFVRCLSGAISTAAYVGALARLPLVNVMVIVYSTPVITVVLAACFLKEQVRIYRWSATFLGFLGIVLMLLPYFDMPWVTISAAGLGMAFALLSAVTSAVSSIQIRRLTETEKTPSIVFYFYFSCAFAAALTLPFSSVVPNPMEWIMLAAIGVVSVFSQLAATESLRFAGASTAVFFDYTIILWSFLIGYFAFRELPGPIVYLGGLLIVVSGIFIIYREQGLKKSSDGPVQLSVGS